MFKESNQESVLAPFFGDLSEIEKLSKFLKLNATFNRTDGLYFKICTIEVVKTKLNLQQGVRR